LSRGVVLFHTIHDLFRLEKELKARGLEVSTVPTPRQLSSDCGTALCFDRSDAATVRSAVAESGMEIEGIHDLED